MSETQASILRIAKAYPLSEDILRLCLVPRTTSEIKNFLERKYSSVASGSTLANTLQKLEDVGGLKYDADKWTTTGNAKVVLEKYFG